MSKPTMVIVSSSYLFFLFVFVRSWLIIKWYCCDDAVWRLSVWRLSHTSGRRPAGWIARIGWLGLARPAWLKAAPACFRCRPGRGHIMAAARPPTACFSCMQVNLVPVLAVTVHASEFSASAGSDGSCKSVVDSGMWSWLLSWPCVILL